jgi:murein L,D-transpeptidase YcbB/YkuD
LTETVLSYARHAMTGRVHCSRVSANIQYKLAFDPQAALAALASSDDIAGALDAFNPQHPAYRTLKAKLAELRRLPADNRPARLAGGPVLRTLRNSSVMMADPRVPKLRKLLGVAAEPNMNCDASLAAAVAKFQTAHGIEPTGQLNSATVEAFNGPRRERQIDAIVATMERWRWLPRELGHTHVVLNIPDYTLRVMHDGAEVWQTRVVVGKPVSQTPLLTETMKFITVNPTWTVRQSIINNELLPVYQSSDPQIFARLGLTVERSRDGGIRVFQPPGERNALGRIRFNFPNRFLVYQHDTPEKHYFAQARRAYSHGWHAGAGPRPIRRGTAVAGLARAWPERGPNRRDVRRTRAPNRPAPPDRGPHHLPDRVRGRPRQAGLARGHLWTRRQNPVADAGARARSCRRSDRAAARCQFQADRLGGPPPEQLRLRPARRQGRDIRSDFPLD